MEGDKYLKFVYKQISRLWYVCVQTFRQLNISTIELDNSLTATLTLAFRVFITETISNWIIYWGNVHFQKTSKANLHTSWGQFSMFEIGGVLSWTIQLCPVVHKRRFRLFSLPSCCFKIYISVSNFEIFLITNFSALLTEINKLCSNFILKAIK